MSAGASSSSKRAHSSAQPGAGRAQPARHAGQAAARLSSAQPGSSDQSTGTQRDRGRWITPGGVSLTTTGGGTDGDEAGGDVTRGGLLQPTSTPRIAAIAQRRPVGWRFHRMWLLLLEALLALALLIFIVWWTMFSGRPKGEPPRPPEK